MAKRLPTSTVEAGNLEVSILLHTSDVSRQLGQGRGEVETRTTEGREKVDHPDFVGLAILDQTRESDRIELDDMIVQNVVDEIDQILRQRVRIR